MFDKVVTALWGLYTEYKCKSCTRLLPTLILPTIKIFNLAPSGSNRIKTESKHKLTAKSSQWCIAHKSARSVLWPFRFHFSFWSQQFHWSNAKGKSSYHSNTAVGRCTSVIPENKGRRRWYRGHCSKNLDNLGTAWIVRKIQDFI